MTENNNLNGQSRSRRTARPYVLSIVALGVLIAIVVAIAQPRETRDGATSPVVPDAAVVADSTPTTPPSGTSGSQSSAGGQGARQMPDAGAPLNGPGSAPR
jgi:hypothetical protein